ncbi:kinase-like domain-containing protein, partial [Tuber borchii]
PRVLISNFGLCKKLGDKSSFGATTTHAVGTSGWRAPELLVDEDSASKPIFPSQHLLLLGCVFYCILFRGKHPPGTRWHREFNIINNNPDLSHLALLGLAEHEAKDLISSMISHDPRKRPDATKVLIHPFFWSAEKQLTFLLDVSDRFEVEKDKEKATSPEGWYKSPFIPLLERNTREVCGGGAGEWMKRLDRLSLAELASNKRRGYDGEKVLDLLRAIRNKKHHYQGMKRPTSRDGSGGVSAGLGPGAQ